MQLSWGSYLFPFNATLVTGGVETQFNAGGQPYSQKRFIDVDGYLNVLGQVDSALQESALRTALAIQFQDLLFKNDNGSLSGLNLRNAGSITGVRIVHGPDFPTAHGPECVSIRSFKFRAEAEYPVLNPGRLLLNFTETLTFEGGAPIFRHRLGINGVNQKQLLYPRDTYRATQSGSSSGYTALPSVPAPIWPYALKEAAKISRTTPERKGKGYQGYSLTWQMEFEDVGPLIGTPTLWIN